MQDNAASYLFELGSKDPAKVALAVETLLEDTSGLSGDKQSGVNSQFRPLNVDLVLFYTNILINSGELEKAGMLIEQEVRQAPHCFQLLLQLGRLDEAQGQYYNAYDLYRQMASMVLNDHERSELQETTERVKAMVNIELSFDPNSFNLKVEGNSKPLLLKYNLQQQKKRRSLLNNLLRYINPQAKSLLEVECDNGLVCRNLAAHGFKVEGTSSNMADLLMAIGFETAENAVRPDFNLPAYFHIDFNLHTAREIDGSDIILVLPPSFEWYFKRGVAETVCLLEEFARKAACQFFYYFPLHEKDKNICADALKFFDQFKKLSASHGEGILAEAELITDSEEIGGRLYRVNKTKLPIDRTSNVLPRGLEITGSPSSILEVDRDRCMVASPADCKKVSGEVSGILPWEENELTKSAAECPKPGSGKVQQDTGSAMLPLNKQLGYLPEIFPRGYIEGYILKKGCDYRFLVTGGRKRFFEALNDGRRSLKCRLTLSPGKVVDIENAVCWPGVKSGHYSEASARTLFNCFFNYDDGHREVNKMMQ